METKPGTVLCIIIVLFSVLHYFLKSPIIPLTMGVLFLLLLGMAFMKAVKEKEKWRAYGITGCALFFVLLMLNYFKII
ncbi:hypothetical protein [Peribacillus sp. SCS-37]|uniref:hypothetical protein n=1 Tax=Paraperibacillus esterisolvens TaxID=3115296 RepID=UPI003905C2A5